MSPANSDPSQDDEFSGGRPLTRREIRERERFLATQNQDVVPAPAYAVADVETRAISLSRGDAPRQPHTPAGEASYAQTAPVVPESAPVPESAAVAESAPVAEPAEAEPVSHHSHVASPDPVAPPVPAVAPATPVAPSAAAPEDHVADQGDQHHNEHDHPEHDDEGYDDAAHHEAAHHGAHRLDAGHHEAEHDDAGHHDGHYDEYGHVAHDSYPGHDADYHYDDHAEDSHHALMDAPPQAVTHGPSKKRRRGRRFVALLLTFFVFVAAIALGVQFLKPLLGLDKAADYPGPGTGVVKVSVEPGAGPRQVAATLEDQKIVANADTFLKEFLAAGGELTPGEFEFKNEMKNSDAVAVLLNRDASKVMYFALNAGLRVNESLEAISKGSGIPFDQLKAMSDAPAQFGVPDKAKNLEGFLAPGEYRFPLGTPAKDILQKLVTTTLDELKVQGITDPAKQYDAIIVASIVQAEGGQADYGNVAGAIYNRLKPGNTETAGLIQSDATVTYGLGRKSFHLEESEKTDKSNPYNTYANPGLPVGPIGSPGKSAIDAAAKPTPNEYLYWVTINLDTKETKFSKTLAEHNVYVEQYNAWCSANAGRCV